jgi:cell division protein FtsQ
MADDDLPSGVVLLDRPRPGAKNQPSAEPGAGVGSSGALEPVELHPRIELRRRTVQEDHDRRRLHKVVTALSVVAAGVVGVALAHTPVVDVDQIDVRGAAHTAAATVAWASGIDRGDALLTLDEAGAERRIEDLPWVADADVVREWPGTVRIMVTEREPAAALQLNQSPQVAVLDASGRVLDLGVPVPPGVAVITGARVARLAEGDVVPASARDALRLAVGARERVPGAVAAVSLDLDATLLSGGVVRFGSVAALDEKLVNLATMLADVDLSNLGVLDLRVPGSPALTRQG